jgi:uncharacterized protein (TIGR01777 family)
LSAPIKRVILAGGSGFLGRSLALDLAARDYRPIVLSRDPTASVPGARVLPWDARSVGPWVADLDGAEAVVNLTGRSVDCRYTPANRHAILTSRVDSVRALGEAVRACRTPPPTWAQAGSLALYGDAGERLCDESAPPGAGFGVDVCVAWEAAFRSETVPHTRKTLLRIGFALGPGGGALAPLARLARFGLGGTVGTGRQYISWLHVADLNAMWRWVIAHADAEGVYNATGPQPVTNREFMATLRRALNRPWSPPTPSLAVHVGAFLMRTEASLALTGRRCVPKRFLDAGFQFAFTDLSATLDTLLRPAAT